jgi:aryl-alcohol dehydrogenase-like predicted oxidoreductase
MTDSTDFRTKKFPLNHATVEIPALGFGTLIPDAALTLSATRDALNAGFRHFDCAERYRNEREVGDALRSIAREDIFVTTKLWNTNHRPERVQPAFEASLSRLGLTWLDLYLIHTPFAFQPGDDPDPRDPNGNVIYDRGVTLLDTWRAMESLVDSGRCGAIGLSDITLDGLVSICESAGSTSISPGNRASGILSAQRHRVPGLCTSGPRTQARASGRPGHHVNRRAEREDAGSGIVGLGDTARHGFAHHAEKRRSRAGEFQHLRSP